MKNIEKSFSIILPTFNEAGHIKKLVLEISNIFVSCNLLFEVIIVDDNSTDGTINIIQDLEKNNSNIIVLVREKKKRSLVNSINDGIFISKYENVIWMDADYSHPPQYIKFFLENKYLTNDLIVFSRFLIDSKRYFDKEKTNPKLIDNLSIILNKICRIMLYKDFTDYSSGFICIKKDLIKNYKLDGYYGDYFIRLICHCFRKNFKILELPYIESDRFSGYSKTTSNKINFIIKSINYLFAIIQAFLKKF
tara:strand:+ start:693 stop:1442 length:750 start_codon:yes stop_codon:yes gene_type:complete